MGTTDSRNNDPQAPDTALERKLRGRALKGADQKKATDHPDYEKARNPDTELHLDDEEDTLYNDGLDLEDDPEDTDTLAGTRGSSSGIKP